MTSSQRPTTPKVSSASSAASAAAAALGRSSWKSSRMRARARYTSNSTQHCVMRSLEPHARATVTCHAPAAASSRRHLRVQICWRAGAEGGGGKRGGEREGVRRIAMRSDRPLAATHLLHVFFKPQVHSSAGAVLHRCNVHAAQGEARSFLLLGAAAAACSERLKLFAAALNIQQSECLLNEGFGATEESQRASCNNCARGNSRGHAGAAAGGRCRWTTRSRHFRAGTTDSRAAAFSELFTADIVATQTHACVQQHNTTFYACADAKRMQRRARAAAAAARLTVRNFI